MKRDLIVTRVLSDNESFRISPTQIFLVKKKYIIREKSRTEGLPCRQYFYQMTREVEHLCSVSEQSHSSQDRFVNLIFHPVFLAALSLCLFVAQVFFILRLTPCPSTLCSLSLSARHPSIYRSPLHVFSGAFPLLPLSFLLLVYYAFSLSTCLHLLSHARDLQTILRRPVYTALIS